MPRVYINGVNLYYEVSGAGSGVVLCHGYGGNHQDWMFQLHVLAQKYQVLTMDHRGHGSSDAPSSPDAYSIPIFANDVHTLLNYLGITKCCLVGHSMGGFIILQLALAHPHLVSSLVLVDTASGPVDIPGYAEVRARLDEISRKDGMEAAFEYNAEHNPLARKRFEKYPRLREISKRRTLETSVDGYVYTGRAMFQRQDLTSRLGEISVPTLVVVGEEDSPFHPPSQILATGIPNARLHVVPQATHSPQEEQPDAFNELLLGFLAEVGGS
jgi:3-oxoadipate enol-lactonase